MAHFAKISEENEVLQVMVVNDSDTQNEEGEEVESIGQVFLQRHFSWPAHLWIKCSYNTFEGKHRNPDTLELSADQSKAFSWKRQICKKILMLLDSTWWAMAAPPASAIPAPCSLKSAGPYPKGIWLQPRFSQATAILRGVFRQMCAPITWPHRRLWSPMRWLARWISI